MSTDFFEHQDAARRQSRRLLWMTALAVVAIIVAVYSVVTLLIAIEGGINKDGTTPLYNLERFVLVVTGVLIVVASGSLYKTALLQSGGEGIALMLGGRRVDPSTADLAEQKLLNVVEEMSIASGIPVPPVFLLDHEPGINAFAAGFSPSDAVIGVNQGTIQHLTRDQLQGVIGHEFSHILNGDMRLNLRLIGLVHGILLLALIGQLLVRMTYSSNSSRNNRDSANLQIVGLLGGSALVVIGSIGVLLARLIKCAISRQREYLADASAVQFTRNPLGLADALKKIGGLAEGSKMQTENAEQACHMFFGEGVFSLNGLLATHPSLADRIVRLDPTFKGQFDRVESNEQVDDEAEALVSPLVNPPAEVPAHVSVWKVIDSIGKPSSDHIKLAGELLGRLPDEVNQATRDPLSAMALVYTLLLHNDLEIRRQQLAYLDQESVRGTVAEVRKLIPFLDGLDRSKRIPLIDLAMRTLRSLSSVQYRRFKINVEDLVRADGHVDSFEYALRRMLIKNLEKSMAGRPPVEVKYGSLADVIDRASVLVGEMARIGHHTSEGVAKAFDEGTAFLKSKLGGSSAAAGFALYPNKDPWPDSVDRALETLGMASPLIKRTVIHACGLAIASDGLVTPDEAELLRAIVDTLDAPAPPSLGH